MSKKIFLSMAITFFIIGCGGGASNTISDNTNYNSNSKVINPDDINLTNDIQNGKVEGYDENGDKEDNYLAVVNYLRSLPIKCNDDLAFNGPVDKIAWNELLKKAALEHSEDMAKQNYFEHDGSGKDTDITAKEENLDRGSRFKDRIKHNGYDYSVSGENIAMYATKPNQPPSDSWIKAIEGLIKSRHGHCSNIMNAGFKEMGMAESRTDNPDDDGWNKAYWTQDFGTN